jgi:hypothetical protein
MEIRAIRKQCKCRDCIKQADYFVFSKAKSRNFTKEVCKVHVQPFMTLLARGIK